MDYERKKRQHKNLSCCAVDASSEHRVEHSDDASCARPRRSCILLE